MNSLYGYPLDEIDALGKEIFTTLADQGISVRFSLLGLCRAITLIGSDEDIDLACITIDRLAELFGRYDGPDNNS